MNSLLESLAALEHEQWEAWSKNLALTEKLSQTRIARWTPLWIPYADLPNKIKDQDRKWAQRVIEIIEKHNPTPKEGNQVKIVCPNCNGTKICRLAWCEGRGWIWATAWSWR